MTNPIRLISIQTTRVPFNDGARGGIPIITPEIASGYCTGLPKHHYYAARLKWALDESVEYYLEIRLWMKAHDLMRKWPLPDKRKTDGTMRDLAKLVIQEMKSPSKLKHDTVKARYLGVDKSTFSRTLKDPYNELFNVLNEWSNCACRHIFKKIAEENVIS